MKTISKWTQKSVSFIIACSLCILCFAQSAVAQKDSTLNKEVEVSKAYRPKVGSASKIKFSPKKFKPSQKPTGINYNINSQRINTGNNIDKLKAAEMEQTNTDDSGLGYLKAGVGNYWTPYGEFYFNKRKSKTTAFGMHYGHISSHGDIKLENDQKVDAPYSNNFFKLFGKHIGRKTTFSADAFYNRDRVTFYGFPGEERIPEPSLNTWQGEKQVYDKVGLSLSLTNEMNSRLDPGFTLAFDYYHFGTETDHKEDFISFGYSYDKELDGFNLVLDGGFDFINASKSINVFGVPEFDDELKNFLFRFNPAISLGEETWNLKAGIMTTSIFGDDESEFNVYPNLYTEWTPVEGVLTLFATADGQLNTNTLASTYEQVPYLTPNTKLENTNNKVNLGGGFYGNFSPSTGFRIEAKYSDIENLPLFVLQSKTSATNGNYIQNTFLPLYTDGNQLTISGELYLVSTGNVNFHMKGNYYNYDLDNYDNAWQLPDFDFTFTSTIRYSDQLTFNADLLLEGGRDAAIYSFPESTTESTALPVMENSFSLDPVIDLSIGANYKYNKSWSFWGRMNNILFQRPERWLGYQEQSFNLLLGASYSF
ncbi:hypothetical protein EYV94_06795 [Puteibacter caeruleilacunae]|nr:hypothetical protein EYV94_06795 [Puteibacter caeruleilacunae]